MLAQVPTQCLQMLHLLADLACTHVKHCVGTSTDRVSTNAALVSGFAVHPRETLCWHKYKRSVYKWCAPTWNTVLAQVPTECLQMLHLSADLACTDMKHCVGTSTNGVSTNAAPVSGFGVHPRETLCGHKYQRSVYKCCTCQRIWRAPT